MVGCVFSFFAVTVVVLFDVDLGREWIEKS